MIVRDDAFADLLAIRAMAVPNVRGFVVGRSLLSPPDGDVARAVAPAARKVHPS